MLHQHIDRLLLDMKLGYVISFYLEYNQRRAFIQIDYAKKLHLMPILWMIHCARLQEQAGNSCYHVWYFSNNKIMNFDEIDQ